MFEFSNNNKIKLSFNDAEFELVPIEAQKGIADVVKRIPDMEAEVLSGKLSIEDACIEMVNGINVILGPGGCEKIFRQRTVTYEDLADVFAYINYKANEFLTSKRKSYKTRFKKHPSNKKGGKKHV